MKKSALLFNLLLSISAFPQKPLDSLRQLLKRDGLSDTSALAIRNEIAKQQMVFHCRVGNSDSALFYAKKVISHNQLNHTKIELAHAHHYLSLAYRSMKDWRSALLEEEKSFAIYTKEEDKNGRAESLQSISEIHLSVRNFREALRKATSALAFARQNNSLPTQKNILKIMALASYHLKSYDMANSYWLTYDSLNEIVHQNEKTQFLASTEVLFQNQKKDSERKLKASEAKLNEQRKELLSEIKIRKELEVVQQELIIDTILGGSIIIVGWLLIILYQFQFKRRSARSLSRNKKELSKQNASLGKATNQLKKALADKELLLKETHHQFKKNIQIIHSLLSLQNSNNSPSSVKTVQGRILSMSLIHQRLRKQDNIVGVEFLSYAKDLMEWLQKIHTHPDQKISCSVEGKEFILNADTAIPLGLILTELITNSFKHAFNHRPDGSIRLDVVHTGSSSLVLDYSDSGPGMQADFHLKSHAANGGKLIANLIAQLDGKIVFSDENGSKVRLVFNSIRSRTPQKDKVERELITL